MKKLFITALVAVSLSFSASAQDITNENAVDNFEATFIDVSDVEWVSNETLTKAFFIQDDKHVQAFYNLDGDFIATATAIDKEELPAYVRTRLQKKYAGYSVTDAFELASDEKTGYFIRIKKGQEKITLKAEGGSITTL